MLGTNSNKSICINKKKKNDYLSTFLYYQGIQMNIKALPLRGSSIYLFKTNRM